MGLDFKIDEIFDRVDDWLLDGRFKNVDDELHTIDIKGALTGIFVAYLSIILIT